MVCFTFTNPGAFVYNRSFSDAWVCCGWFQIGVSTWNFTCNDVNCHRYSFGITTPKMCRFFNGATEEKIFSIFLVWRWKLSPLFFQWSTIAAAFFSYTAVNAITFPINKRFCNELLVPLTLLHWKMFMKSFDPGSSKIRQNRVLQGFQILLTWITFKW